MSKKLTADIYAWLTSIEILNFNSSKLVIDDDGRIEIDKKTSHFIQNGVFFKEIFEKINKLLNVLYGNVFKLDEKVQNIENNNSVQIKIINWTTILEFTSLYYGIKTENDYKTMLVAGDEETFLDFFNKLYTFYITIEDKIRQKQEETQKQKTGKDKSLVNKVNDLFNNDFNRVYSSEDKENPILNKKIQVEGHGKINTYEDMIDLDNPDNDTILLDVHKTRSILEFIISIISKSMSLSYKQSLSLLADHKKYLIYILTRGMQSIDFNPVKEYYKEFLNHIPHYINLIDITSITQPTQISKNIEESLNCIKHGLISNNLEVVFLCGRLLSQIAFEFTEKNLISTSWDWFVMPNGGIEMIISMMRKSEATSNICVSLLIAYGRYHITELFLIYLRKYLSKEGEYIDFLNEILEELSKDKSFLDEFSGESLDGFQKEGVISEKTKSNIDLINRGQLVSIKKTWISIMKEESLSTNMNNRILSIRFITETFIYFSFYIENEEGIDVLNILKKLVRDDSKLVVYSAICHLFRLLIYFSKERNGLAPVIYKSLVFILIEYKDNHDIRHFLLSNFSHLVENIHSLPVGILIEPYCKQYLYINEQTNLEKPDFSMTDLTFLEKVSNHPRLSAKDAILLMDILAKQYDESVFYYKPIKSLLLSLVSRYLLYDIGCEYTIKYIKYLILSYCRLDKSNSDKIFSNGFKKNLNPTDKSYPDEERFNEDVYVKDGQKENAGGYSNLPVDEMNYNVLMKKLNKRIRLELLYEILLIKNTYLNNKVKHLLIQTELRHYKIYNFHNTGLSLVINFFGMSQDVIHYYNTNLDEVEIDEDFIHEVNLIYESPPFIKTFTGNLINEEVGLEEKRMEKGKGKPNPNVDFNKNLESNIVNSQVTENKPVSSKAINGIQKMKEKFEANEKNKEKKREIEKLKEEKYLPKQRRQIKNEEMNEVMKINKIEDNQNEGSIRKASYINKNLIDLITNVDYNNLIKSEGYTSITKGKSNNSNNTFNFYQILNFNHPLFNINNEEDSSLVYLKKVLSDYNRFFKYIHKKYTGSIYHPYYGKEFTSIYSITEAIAPSEINKMLREHEILPKYISKDELFVLIGLMNMKIFKKSTSKNSLSLDEFVELFIQIAYFVFNRPPNTSIGWSIGDYVYKLISLFSQSAEKNSKLTVEYLSQFSCLSSVEMEICNKINEKIDFLGNAHVQVPDGYSKYIENVIIHKFKVPDCMIKVLGRSFQICIEILDEIISNALLFNTKDSIMNNKKIGLSQYHKELLISKGYVNNINNINLLDKSHFLEAFTYVKEVYMVKPSFLKLPTEKLRLEDKEERIKRMNFPQNNQKRKGSAIQMRSKLPDIYAGNSVTNNRRRNEEKENKLGLNHILNRKENEFKKKRREEEGLNTRREVDIERIFDEIDKNQSDDQFKNTIRKYLNESRVENKENNENEEDEEDDKDNNEDKSNKSKENDTLNINENTEKSQSKLEKIEISKEKIKPQSTSNIIQINNDSIYNISLENNSNLELNQKSKLQSSIKWKMNEIKEKILKNNVKNKVELEKIINDETRKIEEKEKEERRLKRMMFVKEELQKQKSQKQEKDKRRLEILSKEKKEEEEKKRKKLEEEEKMRKRIKEELEKLRRLKQNEEKNKKENLKKEMKMKVMTQVKVNEEFNKKQIEKLTSEFNKLKEERKLNNEKRKIDDEVSKYRKLKEKKKYDIFFEEEKKIRLLEKDLHCRIEKIGKEIMNDNYIQVKNEKKENIKKEDNEEHEISIQERSIIDTFKKYKEHIKQVYDYYSKTNIKLNNQLGFDDFTKFCLHFNISSLLLSNDELQFIFKKLAFKTGVTNQKICLSYENFLLSIIYICLFSIDNFIDTSIINTNTSKDVASNKINYYYKICHEKQNLLRKDLLEMFFEYLELSLPYNRKVLENYIHIQSGLSHKERSVLLKNKSDSLPISEYVNYYKGDVYEKEEGGVGGYSIDDVSDGNNANYTSNNKENEKSQKDSFGGNNGNSIGGDVYEDVKAA